MEDVVGFVVVLGKGVCVIVCGCLVWIGMVVFFCEEGVVLDVLNDCVM